MATLLTTDTGGRIDGQNVGYTHTVSLYAMYYLAIKRHEMLVCATTWMNPEDMTISGIRRPQKDKYCVTPVTRGSQQRQAPGDRSPNRGCQGLREGE